jgi:hypothetical protein
MTRFKLPAALALLSVLSPAQTPARGSEGRELPAPPWSFACMTDHGPSDCGEPVPLGSRIGPNGAAAFATAYSC